ncbi:hypothetical protein D3C86_1892260 [compost metagenome]
MAEIPNLQNLMQYICRNGFEHHVVMNASKTAGILKEALGNYMGWEVQVFDEPAQQPYTACVPERELVSQN